MTAKHTPGAGRAADAINKQLSVVNVRIARGRLAAIIDRETSAPELLEALRGLVNRYPEQPGTYTPEGAAIAKAENQNP